MAVHQGCREGQESHSPPREGTCQNQAPLLVSLVILGYLVIRTFLNTSRARGKPETRAWGRRRLYLEDGSIHFLIVILLAGMLPGDAEHGLLVILPDQPRVHAAVNLFDQPLSQPPPAIPVTHPWKENKFRYNVSVSQSNPGPD